MKRPIPLPDYFRPFHGFPRPFSPAFTLNDQKRSQPVSIPHGFPRPFSRWNLTNRRCAAWQFQFLTDSPGHLAADIIQGIYPFSSVSIPHGFPRPFSPQIERLERAYVFQSFNSSRIPQAI